MDLSNIGWIIVVVAMVVIAVGLFVVRRLGSLALRGFGLKGEAKVQVGRASENVLIGDRQEVSVKEQQRGAIGKDPNPD